MADNQMSMFDPDSAARCLSGDLVLRAQPHRPLTKRQRTFNRLVSKIEKLRAELARETCRLDSALAYYV